jgi:hypothetical protein
MEDEIQVEDGAKYSVENTRCYNQENNLYVLLFVGETSPLCIIQ